MNNTAIFQLELVNDIVVVIVLIRWNDFTSENQTHGRLWNRCCIGCKFMQFGSGTWTRKLDWDAARWIGQGKGYRELATVAVSRFGVHSGGFESNC